MTKSDQALLVETEGTLAAGPSDGERAARVLAVDDEPAACKLLSLILGPPGFQCATAGSGQEAMATLQHEQFDAVISDLQMPGISGMELLAEVRRLHPHMAFWSPPVWMMSTWVCGRCVAVRTTISLNLSGKAPSWQASRTRCISGNSSDKSKTIVNTSKKWLRSAQDSYKPPSSRSSTVMRTHCRRLVGQSISATMKRRGIRSGSAVTRLRLPGRWAGPANSWRTLPGELICTTSESSESPTAFC